MKKTKYKMKGGGIFPVCSKTYHKATVFKEGCYFLRKRQRYQQSTLEGPGTDQHRHMHEPAHTHTHTPKLAFQIHG